ncbi:NADP-dependent oxidoreductase [Nocardia vinacea]|uniref:NADP-dependent oxidoreductase n=1 Tax=Nocardia vinacea TaxID=96468 RepID=UPI0002DD8694|nr:NADP-dependent oxidoreductase [Nocardia vinacea]
MSETMQAISQNELGGPEVLRSVTLPIPAPGIGEVVVRVHAAAVNPVDALARQSGLFVSEPPFVLGWDISGQVAAVGPGSTLYQLGDEVFGMLPFPHGHGAYAEYAVAPARVLVPKPKHLDHIHAAALPLAGLTAWQALVDTARIDQDSRVLINGAAGGVGHLAVQIAKIRGAHVIALASARDADFVTAVGADEVIDYTTTDFTQAVKEVDAVLEVIGGDYPARALDVLKPGGVLVSTLPPSVTPLEEEAAARGVRVAGLFVEADRLGMTALAEFAVTGELIPAIAATFPLDHAAAAHSTKSGPGKTVLTLV